MTNLVVDSSAYIDLLRAGVDVRQPLVPFLRSGKLYNCGVIRAEVLRGMKTPSALAGLEEFFDIVPEIPSDAKLWRQVSQLGWDLARKGKWPPVTDLIIAASCLRIGATLVTRDAHFQNIPRLKILQDIPG
jgi:predicted nucleic acid-binding protein